MADEQAAQTDKQLALRSLAEVAGMYRHELTEFEMSVWLRIVEAVPLEQFMGFLRNHVASSPFAPKPSDASKAFDLAVDPDSAYVKLARMVREVGPYESPELPDDPVLVTAVLLMGGWATVNEQMPDPMNSFAVKAFRERFDACFIQAVNQVRVRGVMPSQPLLAIGDARRPQPPALEYRAQPQLPQSAADGNAAASPRASRSHRFGNSPA